MSSSLYRLGLWAFRHHWRVILGWVLVLLVAGGGAAALNRGTDNAFSIPGTESTAALAQLSRTFPQVSGTSATYVVIAPEGRTVTEDDLRAPVETLIDTVTALDDVIAVADPYAETATGLVSDGGRAAVVSVQIRGQSSTVGEDTLRGLDTALERLRDGLPSGAQAELGGDLFTNEVPTLSASEVLGVIVALVVLLVTLGSLLAAAMPILTALLGVALTMAVIF
ncbi:MAG TPA: MMPL family transporter, partial [Actinotalea sp.]|nr:MMPL family transporter [Actinotalea sp.]